MDNSTSNSQWQSISALPDSDIAVLIATPDGPEDVWVGYHDGEIWRQIDGNEVEGRVTHWMDFPLPPAPTAVNRPMPGSNAHLEARNGI